MSEHVRVRPLGPLAYGAEVRDGQDTTQHHVTLSQAFLDDLLIPDADPVDVVTETIHYLLEIEPGTAIPHELALDHLSNHDHDYLTDLRARLTG